jgi:hypothetical protein
MWGRVVESIRICQVDRPALVSTVVTTTPPQPSSIIVTLIPADGGA